MPTEVIASNGSHYSMLLPETMEPTHTNDSAASLEYGDSKNQLYLEVIGDSKAKIISFGLDYDLEPYMKIAARQLDDEGLYVNQPTTINGYKALQAEIVPKKNNSKNIHYKLTCVETPKFFYQLMLYSPNDFVTQDKSEIDKIVYSFKEIDK